jgi:hypothetical protein
VYPSASSSEEYPSAPSAKPGKNIGDAVPTTPGKCPGVGILLTNNDSEHTEFNFFENFRNGNGQVDPNFDQVDYSAIIEYGETKFVPLPLTFKGTVRRGSELPATFVEF